MNHCAIQQSNFAACDEIMRSYSSISETKEAVVCPKPRRISSLRPLRWQVSRYWFEPWKGRVPLQNYVNTESFVLWAACVWIHQQDLCDSRAGADLLDIILTMGGTSVDHPAVQVASSPPFFCGSPPSRVSNPLTQDARFGDDKVTPVSPRAIPISSGLASSPSSSSRKGGCVRANFGNNPAVRVEGFDCLDRDRRNCSIPALA